MQLAGNRKCHDAASKSLVLLLTCNCCDAFELCDVLLLATGPIGAPVVVLGTAPMGALVVVLGRLAFSGSCFCWVVLDCVDLKRAALALSLTSLSNSLHTTKYGSRSQYMAMPMRV